MCRIGTGKDRLPEIGDIFLVDVIDTSRTRPTAALTTKSMDVSSVVVPDPGGQN
jgi:hypothetical protein